MGSKFVLVVTFLAVVVVGLIDWFWHGHYTDNRRKQAILNELQAEHIGSLVGPPKEAGGVPEPGSAPEVRVTDRTAYVSGLVDTASDRERATDATLRTPGLLTVYNDIHLDAIDEELLKRLDSLLAGTPNGGHFEHRVGPDNHTVTLSGWVPKDQPALKDAIASLVARMPGVRKVNDNLTVGAPELGQLKADILSIMQDRTIYFDYNKATIRPESMKYINSIADLLINKYKDVRLRIEGHTDAIAGLEYNQKLSEARAASVKAALVAAGVDGARLETIGYGKTRPIAPNNTPEGRSDNRRIEFTPLPGDSGTAAPQK